MYININNLDWTQLMMTQIGRNWFRICQICAILMQFYAIINVKLRLKPLRLVLTIILLGIFSAVIYCIIVLYVKFIFFTFVVSSVCRNSSKRLIN